MRFKISKSVILVVAITIGGGAFVMGGASAASTSHQAKVAPHVKSVSFLNAYEKILKAYEASVKWDGPSIAAKAPKNVFIGAVNCTYAEEGCKSGGITFTEVAKVLGWRSKIIIEDNAANYGADVQTLLNEGVQALYLGGVEEQLVPYQINEARARHIPIVSAGSNYILGGKGEVTTDVHPPVAVEGQLMADAAIVQNKGDVDALLLQDAEFAEPVAVLQAVKKQFAACSQCKITYAPPINFTSSIIDTTLPGEVVTALARDPKINSIMLGFDPPASFIVPALDAAGDRNKVTIYTQLGDSGPMALVKQDNVVRYDVAGSVPWDVWGDFDEVIRYLDKQPLVAENIPLELFTSSNPARITTDTLNDFAATFAGYEQKYESLWGVKS